MNAKILDSGSAVATTVTILKANTIVSFENPERMAGDRLEIGSLGRIHSQVRNTYNVWILDDGNMNSIIVNVPHHLMGQFFKQHAHGIFPHFA